MNKTPSRINVDVTQEDIDKAHKSDSYNCMVSQTVARVVPNATNIETDIQTIRFTVDGERRVYLTPYAAQGYVIAFDAGEVIEPFKFQLRNPVRVMRKRRTEAGKIAARAATRASREAQNKKPAKKNADDPAKAARAAYAQARLDNPGPVHEQPAKGEASRKAPPRVWKKKRRQYGHRLLRINQEDAE